MNQYQRQNSCQPSVNYQKEGSYPNSAASNRESMASSNGTKHLTSTLAYDYKNNCSFVSWLCNLISKPFTRKVKVQYAGISNVRMLLINIIIYGACFYLMFFSLQVCCPTILLGIAILLVILLIIRRFIDEFREK